MAVKLTREEQLIRDELEPAEEIEMRTRTARDLMTKRNRHQRIVYKLDDLMLRELALIRDLLR